jgi:hypothetical protein
MTFLNNLQEYSVISESDENELCELRDIKKIENAFSDEVSLLFYLGLNKVVFGYSRPDLPQHPVVEQGRLVLPPQREEVYRLGAPKERLMAILTKDNDIKEWFLAWMESLIRYRKYTSEQMSKFYNEVIESNEHVYSPIKPEDNAHAVLIIDHEEYDMTKVCSDIESIYEY